MKHTVNSFKKGDVVRVVSRYGDILQHNHGHLYRGIDGKYGPYIVSGVCIGGDDSVEQPKVGVSDSFHYTWLQLDKNHIVTSILNDL